MRREPPPPRPVAQNPSEQQKAWARSSFRMPPDVTFPQAPDSPAPVTFRHASHVDATAPDCLGCHRGDFSFLKAASPRKPAASGVMHQTCGQCHDGTSAFSVEANCENCHGGTAAKE